MAHHLHRLMITAWLSIRVWREQKRKSPVCVDYQRKVRAFRWFQSWLLFCLEHNFVSSCAINPVPAVKVLQGNMAESSFLGGAVKGL